MRLNLSFMRSIGIRVGILLCGLLFSALTTLKAQKAEIQSIIQQVSLDSLLYSVNQLTGITPVNINGQSVSIFSRYRDQTPNAWAAIYLKNRLDAYGYETSYQYFDALGQNILGYKKGSVFPNRVFVISAHYDAIAIPYNQAVGADDNASGCAGVLEAARLLKDVELPYSVLFVFFDEEEQGLIGSNAFTEQFDWDQYQVEAVFNLDMIGYDDNQDFRAEIHTRPYGNSIELAEKIIGLNDTFQIGLDLVIKNPGTTASDHDAFWQMDRTAILLIEDKMDFNRYYHTKFDSVQYFHDSFFYRNTQFAIASLCWFASVEENTLNLSPANSKDEFLLYPNPSNGNTRVYLPENGVLELYGVDGKRIYQETLEAGEHPLHLNAFGHTQLMVRFIGETSQFPAKWLLLSP
ncbi:MAG: M20/M25/M40 family metallo-hydrolase [Bacteroidota bacterium]|nr:M20/M25/M40 family metallo-hydrolase [Bacteroidota bacterium]MDX5430552.1 M20/M25/M40 family metallo-hydrolase [Bacteroidota bacterium]MDX5469304.1 M20/M25/M40 family metallo-hydrolase [Bacteroidota bacterium]